MEQDFNAGQTDSSVAVEGATTPTGNDRLPPDGETPVRAGMEGTWIVVAISMMSLEWCPFEFATYDEALNFWNTEGGYLCKNHTPV